VIRMDTRLPLICPVLHYDSSTEYWVCERHAEYETLKKAGWPLGFCNGIYTGRSDYLNCPAFSHWFWEQVCLLEGEKVKSTIKKK